MRRIIHYKTPSGRTPVCITKSCLCDFKPRPPVPPASDCTTNIYFVNCPRCLRYLWTLTGSFLSNMEADSEND